MIKKEEKQIFQYKGRYGNNNLEELFQKWMEEVGIYAEIISYEENVLIKNGITKGKITVTYKNEK